MRMIGQVKAALEQALSGAGIPAVSAWKREGLPALSGAAAVVGIAGSESGAAAFSEYLGTAWDGKLGCPVERFGRRLELRLYVDLYAPRTAAEQIEDAWEKLEERLLEPVVPGLRLRGLQRGSTEHDKRSGYLKCRCTAACTAYFTAERSEEGALLQDFILKGMVK